MRVCMVAYTFYEYDTRVRQYASALVERGDTVDVIALGRGGERVHAVVDGVNVYRIQSRTINEKGFFTYFYRISRFLIASALFVAWKHLDRRYQFIHVHSVPDFLVFAAAFPKLTGSPVVLDIHDLLPELYASKFHARKDSLPFKLLLLIERISIAFANHVIIANHLWCERVAARTRKPGKCSTIRNYPDPRLFHPQPHENGNGKFVLTYPGTLNWHQGVDIAIKAFAKVKDQIPEAEFHIYGEGPAKPSLIELSESLGLKEKVIFHELLPTYEIARVMANTDLAVEPKRAGSAFGNEALSMKILEFMGLGVPLVVSRTKIHAYYYDDSMVKFYEKDNDEELAAGILLLRRDADLRQKLTTKASDYVSKNNWEVRKTEYLQLVDSLA